jgi:hypothetical protein
MEASAYLQNLLGFLWRNGAAIRFSAIAAKLSFDRLRTSLNQRLQNSGVNGYKGVKNGNGIGY